MFKIPTPKRKKLLVTELPTSLRTNISEIIYARAKSAGETKPLLEEVRLKEWNFWAIIENAFPYDMAFKVHHLLIPKRVVCKSGLTSEEKIELEKILDEITPDYDCHLTNFTRKQSITTHFHIHLLTYKDQRIDMAF